jgi:hypothetical protein
VREAMEPRTVWWKEALATIVLWSIIGLFVGGAVFCVYQGVQIAMAPECQPVRAVVNAALFLMCLSAARFFAA